MTTYDDDEDDDEDEMDDDDVDDAEDDAEDDDDKLAEADVLRNSKNETVMGGMDSSSVHPLDCQMNNIVIDCN